MGIVYLAMHEGPGFERPVALKIIRRGLDTDDVLRRFQLERRILAALKHPNVANMVDAGQTPDGRPFFVMDFVEGAPLDVFAEREQLSVRDRLKLFQKICDAVQHAHNNLVLHRDLKPGNILVGSGGVPILLDFGIAKLIEQIDGSTDRQVGGANQETTRTGLRAFTPEYAAPEQLRGDPVSTATDIYGLGLLLYRLLTGRRPFDPSSGFEYEKAVLEKEPPRPSSFGNRALAGDLDTIVLKALRKEPERRYTSVAALSDDVQRHIDGLPVRARADTFGYRAGKFARRNALVLSAGAIVFVSLIAATLYSRAQTQAVTRERDKALEVQNFLLETFGARGGGDTVAVRSVLDAQASLVPIAYADRPELHGQMLHVLAESYDRLSQLAQAEPMAREALRIRRASLTEDHPDIAASTSLLGWVLHARGKSDSGEVYLREAASRWEQARPTNPLAYSRTLNDLGVVRESRGNYDDALSYYRQALAIRRSLPGRNDRAIGTTMSNLSVVLWRKGEIPAAIAAAETALVAMRRATGPDHQRSLLIQGNMASFRGQTGDFAGAEELNRDVLERQTRVLGRRNPTTAGTMMNLASVLRSQLRNAEAESLVVEVVSIFEEALGPDHVRTGTALSMRGNIRSAMRKFPEARRDIEQALAISRKQRGEVHRDVGAALSSLGLLHFEMRNLPESERVLRQSLDVYEKAQGKQHIETATTRARLAGVVLARGRPGDALGLYRDAEAAMVSANVRPTAAPMRELRIRLAQTLLALRRPSEADSVLRAVPDSGLSRAQKSLVDSLRGRISGR